MSSHGWLTKGLVPTRDGVEKPVSVFESDRHVAGEPVRLLRRVSQGPRGHPDRPPGRQGVGGSRGRPPPRAPALPARALAAAPPSRAPRRVQVLPASPSL